MIIHFTSDLQAWHIAVWITCALALIGYFVWRAHL